VDQRGLVERARGGDHDAFTVLARDAATRLERAARLILRSWEGQTDGCCQLWVVNANGTNPHRFESVGEAAWTGLPSVSPDGRWVSYWSVLGNSGNLQIRVAPADGSGPSIATGPTMTDFYPWLWAPDSSKMLMFLEDGSSTSAYLLDPEGGPYEQVPWTSGSGIDWQRLAP
jgi:hypothetical protein